MTKKERSKATSEAMKASWARRKQDSISSVPAKKTNLGFIREIRKNHRCGWTIEKASQLCDAIQQHMADATYGGYKFDPKLASKVTGMSANSCQQFVNELRKADKEGYTLEQYFRLGRPFRIGGKVLA